MSSAEGNWRWPNFSPAEIACRGTGKLLVYEAAFDKLEALRAALGKPLIVRSACRSPEHNRAVGGAKRSKHMEGTAFESAMSNRDPAALEAAARSASSASASIRGRTSSMSTSARSASGASVSRRVHSSRARRRWRRSSWPRAGAATVGAAGVEVAHEVLAETQGAALPLVPYLDSLRWVFIAAVLTRIAVAIYALGRLEAGRRRRLRSASPVPKCGHGRR